MQAGADIEARDDRQRTPLHAAAEFGPKSIMKLLIERGIEVNVCDEKLMCPLQMAIRLGRWSFVEYLMCSTVAFLV